MATPYDEKALVLSLRQGHEKAFEQMYGRFYSALLGVINQIVKNPLEAEDLLQDTFVKAWLHFDQYDPERGRLFSWLIKIARNKALDYLRQHRIICLTSLPEEDLPPAAISCWPSTDIIELEGLVRQWLKPQQWRIVELAYWYGYTHQEIAQQLALPLGTVKTQIYRSMLQLRPLFGEASKPGRSGTPYGSGAPIDRFYSGIGRP